MMIYVAAIDIESRRAAAAMPSCFDETPSDAAF